MNDIGIRLISLDLFDCALTVDMIWQTTQKAVRYEYLYNLYRQLTIGCQQPTLALFTAVSDNRFSSFVWRICQAEQSRTFQRHQP